MAKVTITITDDEGGASVEAEVHKLETEGNGTTLAEKLGAELMEVAASMADEVIRDGEPIKNNKTGGYDGKH